MSGALSPVVRYVVLDAEGVPVPGAKLSTFLSGTTTPAFVYSDPDLAVGHQRTNPVIADAGGVLPPIYLANINYRFLVTDANDVTIYPPTDNIFDKFGVFLDTTQTANRIFAGPATGSPAAPTFRALTMADLPVLGTPTTWTPSIGGDGGQSGQAYTLQAGGYTKIGPWVFITGQIVLSTLGTITGNVQIHGLPFTVLNAPYTGALQIPYWLNFASSVITISALPIANTTGATLYVRGSAGTGVASLAQADLSATTDIAFTGLYLAST